MEITFAVISYLSSFAAENGVGFACSCLAIS